MLSAIVFEIKYGLGCVLCSHDLLVICYSFRINSYCFGLKKGLCLGYNYGGLIDVMVLG